MDRFTRETQLMRMVLKRFYNERSDREEAIHDEHSEALATVFAALRDQAGAVDGFDNVGTWPALDEAQVLQLLTRLMAIRDFLGHVELELLDAAQYAGISWETLETVYTTGTAPVAKGRYAELAMRHNGEALLGRASGDR